MLGVRRVQMLLLAVVQVSCFVVQAPNIATRPSVVGNTFQYRKPTQASPARGASYFRRPTYTPQQLRDGHKVGAAEESNGDFQLWDLPVVSIPVVTPAHPSGDDDAHGALADSTGVLEMSLNNGKDMQDSWDDREHRPSQEEGPKDPDYYANVGEAKVALVDELTHYFDNGGLRTSHIYDSDIILNDPYFTKFHVHGRGKYLSIANTTAWAFNACWAELRVHLLSFSDHASEGSFKVRWRITGHPKLSLEEVIHPGSHEKEYIEGVSVYYFNNQGRIREHHITIVHPNILTEFNPTSAFPWPRGIVSNMPCPN